MVTRNDRRTVATKTARANRKLTVRHAAPRPAGPQTDEIESSAELEPVLPSARAAEDRALTRRWRLAAWSLVVVLAGVLAAVGVLARQAYDQGQLDAARQHAMAAARQATVDFVSISAATIDSDLQRISDHATGEFKDEFTQDMPQVRAAVVDNKVDSHGTVLRAAIVSSSRSSAVLLVAVDATVKNTNAPDGRLSHYRIRVTMAAQSNRWLVAKLEFVG
jgi:Mce-associated membrane protein